MGVLVNDGVSVEVIVLVEVQVAVWVGVEVDVLVAVLVGVEVKVPVGVPQKARLAVNWKSRPYCPPAMSCASTSTVFDPVWKKLDDRVVVWMLEKQSAPDPGGVHWIAITPFTITVTASSPA